MFATGNCVLDRHEQGMKLKWKEDDMSEKVFKAIC